VTSVELSGLAPFSVFFFVLLVVKLPLDEGLIAGSGKEELNALSIQLFFANDEGGDPSTVTYANTPN